MNSHFFTAPFLLKHVVLRRRAPKAHRQPERTERTSVRWPLLEQVGTVPMDLCKKWTGRNPASRIVILNCMDFLYTYVIIWL